MKKILFFAFALVAGALGANAQASLDTTQIDGIWYILDKTNHTATVTYGPATGEAGMWGGIGQDTYSGRLIIPETLNAWDDQLGSFEYTVNAIGDNAFAWCSNLSGIVIPKTVLTVGENIFQRTGGVTELKIADGNESITFAQGTMDPIAYTCTYLYLGRNVADDSGVPVFHTWSEVLNVVIGENVTEIPLAFCPYARNLQSVQINTPNVLTRGTRMFGWLDEDTPQPDASSITLYVPEGLANAYNADAFWSRFTIEEMDKEQQYGIKYAESTFHFRKDGLFYQIQEDQYNHKRLAVVMPQVWYLNPDGSYVSQWSAEYPYTESSIIIPDSVTYWKSDEGIYSRYSGTPVTGWDKYTWPVEIIGDYCFRNAKNLESVTIPSTVYRIGTEVFEYTDKLHSLTIPESIKEVGWLAFARSGLKEVVIPASSSNWLESNAAFQDNENLTKVTFAQGTTAIQDRIFFGCVALRTIIIPEGVTEIGAGAFAGCSALTELNLPSTLEVMGDRMLRGCPIRSLLIPANVREIAPSGLLGATLVKLSVDPANTVFDSRDNCNAIIRTADNTLIAAANGAFIPASVDSIESEAFSELDGMRSITLPAGLKKVKWGAFMNLSHLTLITSNLRNPAGVLESDAFSSWYANQYEEATLYVPAGTLAAYQADPEWAKFQHIVEMTAENKPASVEDIAPIAESGTTSLAGLATNADLTNAVVGNLYLTCDTTNGDHYDAAEQALVLNTVVDEVMIENVLANPDNMDVIRNNFSGIILTIPAGTGTLSLTIQTTGDREVAVLIEGSEAETFAQAAKGLINIPYEVTSNAYVFIYGVATDEEETPAAAPSKFRARAKRTEAAENSVSIYDVQWEVTSTTGIEDVHIDASSTPRMIMIDNIIYILRGGKIYTIQGLEVK